MLLRDEGLFDAQTFDALVRVDAGGHDPDLANNAGSLIWESTEVYGGDGSGCFIGTLND
jgi:hypothetical protein